MCFKIDRLCNLLTVGLAVLFLFGTAAAAAGGDISVQAAVDKREVYVGEPFMLQIQINGDDSPAEPDLSALSGFAVEAEGGRQNNSESVTIINGRVSRVSRHGYVFNYRLTPRKKGRLVIPAVSVTAGGRTLSTRPINILAREPEENENFKLRLRFTENKCFVGEPLILEVTWYIGQSVKDFDFNLPLLDDPGFMVEIMQPPDSLRQDEAVTIPLSKGEATAVQGRGTLDGRQFTTVTFKLVLTPVRAGDFTLPQATVSCKIPAGYRQSRRRGMFDDFFNNDFPDDFFGFSRRQVYRTIVIPSNRPTIKVAELPAAGRPADFSGLVGEFSLAAKVSPTQVNVGDPITLNIMVTGPEFLKNVDLPPLQEQAALAGDFKIPREMAPGEINGRVKTFTQTIRAIHSRVKEIPSLTLTYFNPRTEKYEVAHTEPIPITVRDARVVTARDAEGAAVPEVKKEITALNKGIAFNYDDEGVLADQGGDFPGGLQSLRVQLVLLVPPGFYFVLLLIVSGVRKRRRDPAALKARKAYGEFAGRIKRLEKAGEKEASDFYNRLDEALRGYLGAKLRLTAGALTYQDVAERLKGSGVDDETLDELKRVLDYCEAHRYAGGSLVKGDREGILPGILDLAKKIDSACP